MSNARKRSVRARASSDGRIQVALPEKNRVHEDIARGLTNAETGSDGENSRRAKLRRGCRRMRVDVEASPPLDSRRVERGRRCSESLWPRKGSEGDICTPRRAHTRTMNRRINIMPQRGRPLFARIKLKRARNRP